jgi:hypothetical protein
VSAHEDFSRPGQSVNPSSDRTFGLVISAFFLVAGVWPLVHGRPVRFWMVAVSGAFLVSALIYAQLLHPLNRAWTALAILMHRLISPVALGVLFYVVVTPIALCMRWFKRDALHLRADPSAATYWVPREPPGPTPESMLHQF